MTGQTTPHRHPPLLSGVRVLDLSRVLAGPICTMMLGDYGADVIKVEHPLAPDATRGWGPPFDELGESAYFLSVNRNKLSVALDLSRADDMAIARDLACGADVVVENFLPGALAKLGLDANAVLAVEPRLVWCTIAGFDRDPSRPGYDVVVQAESGWMSITGERDGAPMKVGVALADVVAGKDAAIAVLAALAGRERGALSTDAADRRLTITLAHSATAALVNVAQNVLVAGADAERWGNAHPNLCPYELFSTSDVPIVIAVGSDSQWRALVDALVLPALAADASLDTNAGRVLQRDRVVRAIADRVRLGAARHWETVLGAVNVPCGVVRSVREALADVTASPRTGVAPRAPGRVRLEPPRLDEHGALIRAYGWGAFARREPTSGEL